MRDSVRIPLTNGGEALVAPNDEARVRQRRWRRSALGYAVSTIPGTQRVVWMHRWILEAPAGWDVDHRNGDRLDNRRGNLRICDRANNLANSAGHRDSRTGVKGVTFRRDTGRFVARIMTRGKVEQLGNFNTPEAAGRAYRRAAKRLQGAFACSR